MGEVGTTFLSPGLSDVQVVVLYPSAGPALFILQPLDV